MTQISVSVENLQTISRTARTQSGQLSAVERAINSAIVGSGWTSPAAGQALETFIEKITI